MTAKRKKTAKQLGIASNGYVSLHLIEARGEKQFCPCGEEMKSETYSGVQCSNGHWFCF